MWKTERDNIVVRIRGQLEMSGKHSFTLREVENLYRFSWGSAIPFRDYGVASLQEFLEKYCDFLTVMKPFDNNDAKVQLNPPKYHEGYRTDVGEGSHQGLFEQVHSKVPDHFLKQLKALIEEIGQNGITVDEFENAFYEAKSKQINYKGFQKDLFYRGLSDIFRIVTHGSATMLYPVKHVKPKKRPQPQQSEEQRKSLEGKVSQKVSPKVQLTLRNAIQDCPKQPGGWTSFDEFQKFFYETSWTQFSTYGFTADDFFHGLPHIFHVEHIGGSLRIYPADGVKPGLSRCKASTASVPADRFTEAQRNPLSQTTADLHASGRRSKKTHCKEYVSNDKNSKQPNHNPKVKETKQNSTPVKAVPVKSPADAATPKQRADMTILPRGQQLWKIHCGGESYVPTYCVSQLAGLQTDSVVEHLRTLGLQPTSLKKLDDECTLTHLIRNQMAHGTNVMMLPLKNCPTIIRAIMGRQTDEALIDEINRHIKN